MLQRHNTPLLLCALATPPQFRRREDVYRESMDPKIAQDTAPVHCTLDRRQTSDFLAKIFPDSRLFPPSNAPSSAATGSISSVIGDMKTIRQRSKGCWAYFPDLSNSECLEEKIAQFFNGIIQHIPNSHMCTRRWTGKASDNPVSGLSGATRKPDLLLCEEGVITKRGAQQEKFDMRTDVYAMGEVKKKYSEDNKKDSYIELAGKVAFLLEAQDGRYATPGIQLLGSEIILTFFDRGGSISTHPLDIHQSPEEFLRILLGVTFADGTILGFDSTVSPTQNNQKIIRILKQGKEYEILVDTLLFFSGSLHSRGTTVWKGKVSIDQEDEEVVIKDSWVDPLRRYTEGRILKMLEMAGVKGVPRLVHEQQVRAQHPVTRELLNHSTHILRTLVEGSSPSSYYLRVQSRLVSKPRGYPIFDFASLPELLVGLIDCLRAHCDALNGPHVLHRDISLFNLFLVMAIHSELDEGFLDRVLQEHERTAIRAKIQKLPRRGLLGDWGYAVPMDDSHCDDSTLRATPGIHVNGETAPLSQSDLRDTHDIIIPVADEPLPSDSGSSIDTSPLQRTGTWAWMAAELSHVGPGTPVVHRAHHDLESFFYILLAICLLYDHPGKLKPAKLLSQCFDPFFAVAQPSTLKIVTIQSDFGWTTLMIPYISSYFQPLIPLLEKIRKELILPIKLQGGVLQANQGFTHNEFVDSIVMVLTELPEKYWVPKISNTRNVPVLQSSSTSSASSIPGTPSTTPSTVTILPDGPLPRLPLIRIPGTSSTSSSKRRLENEDESGSRLAKRRSPAGETTGLSFADVTDSVDVSSPATSWTKVDISSSHLQTPHHTPSAPP